MHTYSESQIKHYICVEVNFIKLILRYLSADFYLSGKNWVMGLGWAAMLNFLAIESNDDRLEISLYRWMLIIDDYNFDLSDNEAQIIYQSMIDLCFRSNFRENT